MHDTPTLWLHHAEHGELPARRLVDCVFALAPSGRILHYHIEQMDIDERVDEVHLTLTTRPPHESRARCQVIPPRVTEFRQRAVT